MSACCGFVLLAGLCIARAAAATGEAPGPENVLVVVNRQSPVSLRIGDYYTRRRSIPARNLCKLNVAPAEEIARQDYQRAVEAPIAECLTKQHLEEQVLFIVTTLGVPLKVAGAGAPMQTEAASVDSELCLLYGRLKQARYTLAGSVPNPFFRQIARPFRHADFPQYLVTRLAGFDFDDVRVMIDHALMAVDRGKVVIDVRADNNTEGNAWLRSAASLVPRDRLILDDSATVLYGLKDVIAYASWGSNDPDRHRRVLGFEWLPGAIMTEYVSTNGRTFARPPTAWTIGSWKDVSTWFAGAPQTLSADEIHEGITGASGHVYEPFLAFTPRPDLLIPAYLSGRTLAESYYVSIRGLSWQNIVLGDPLCRLVKR